MIHCDTACAQGEDVAAEAVAKHIDLAINVYVGPNREMRLSQRLGDGKITDASFRTHLFRIDDAHLRTVLQIAEYFLQSKVLLKEWFSEQFGSD